MIGYENNAPVLVAPFEYPGDADPEPEPESGLSPFEYRLQGFNLATALFIDWIATARTNRARNIRLAALRCAFSRSPVNFTVEARRLGCTREHFSKAVSHIRRAMPLPK
jgi:hypothetical protein